MLSRSCAFVDVSHESTPDPGYLLTKKERASMVELGAGGVWKLMLSPGDKSGRKPQPGYWSQVHYSGRLTDGTLFGDTRDRNAPYYFELGGRVSDEVAGFGEAVATMEVGERALFLVAPHKAYGKAGLQKAHIPPDAALVFRIELLGTSKYEQIQEGVFKRSLKLGQGWLRPSGCDMVDLRLRVFNWVGGEEDGGADDQLLYGLGGMPGTRGIDDPENNAAETQALTDVLYASGLLVVAIESMLVGERSVFRICKPAGGDDGGALFADVELVGFQQITSLVDSGAVRLRILVLGADGEHPRPTDRVHVKFSLHPASCYYDDGVAALASSSTEAARCRERGKGIPGAVEVLFMGEGAFPVYGLELACAALKPGGRAEVVILPGEMGYKKGSPHHGLQLRGDIELVRVDRVEDIAPDEGDGGGPSLRMLRVRESTLHARMQQQHPAASSKLPRELPRDRAILYYHLRVALRSSPEIVVFDTRNGLYPASVQHAPTTQRLPSEGRAPELHPTPPPPAPPRASPSDEGWADAVAGGSGGVGISIVLGEGEAPLRVVELALRKMQVGEVVQLSSVPAHYAWGAEGDAELGVPPHAMVSVTIKLIGMNEPQLPDQIGPTDKINAATIEKESGTSKFKAGRVAEALRRYESGIAILCHDAELSADQRAEAKQMRSVLHTNAALCLEKLGKLEAAGRACTAAIEADHTNHKAFFRRGSVRSRLLDFDGARADFAMAREGGNEVAVQRALAVLTRRKKAHAKRERRAFGGFFENTANKETVHEEEAAPSFVQEDDGPHGAAHSRPPLNRVR